ncbi:MAG: hypothetical protein IGS39_17720 [Calothrix sp. C42_A2020_038]|nr:hypothetical protein [Calothrix sp. C42_A2020_038]
MKVKSPDFNSLVKEVMSDSPSIKRLQELSQKNVELARLIAKNPASPSELLKMMARRRDKVILSNVTVNPNTPTEVLFQLGRRFPEQFLKNPILSLLLLENPKLFQEMPLSILDSLRDYILERYYCSDTQTQELESNFMLAPDFVLQQLLQHKNHSLRCYIARHPNTPLSFLEQLASDNYDYVRHNVALNPNTPVHLLEKLAEDTTTYVRHCVAKNPNISLKLILKLADDASCYVNEGVVYNPHTPAATIDNIIDKLKQQQYGDYTLARIAGSYDVPAYVLEKLAVCDIRRVRTYIAYNKRTPEKTLKNMALVKDEHWLVLREIARNPATPVEILEQMTQEPRKSIRTAAEENLSVSQKIKSFLL